MKTLTCEMCGSTNLIKQDSVFVCQQCGTKYSVEEARKMMVEGTVKIDSSEELNNLLILARRAKENSNYEKAAKYYEEICIKDPDNWEANFYSLYCECRSCKIGEVERKVQQLISSCQSSLSLLKQSTDKDNITRILDMVLSDLIDLTKIYLVNKRQLGVRAIMLGCTLLDKFGDEVFSLPYELGDTIKQLSIKAWVASISLLSAYEEDCFTSVDPDLFSKYEYNYIATIAKIRAYDKTYMPSLPKEMLKGIDKKDTESQETSTNWWYCGLAIILICIAMIFFIFVVPSIK